MAPTLLPIRQTNILRNGYLSPDKQFLSKSEDAAQESKRSWTLGCLLKPEIVYCDEKMLKTVKRFVSLKLSTHSFKSAVENVETCVRRFCLRALLQLAKWQLVFQYRQCQKLLTCDWSSFGCTSNRVHQLSTNSPPTLHQHVEFRRISSNLGHLRVPGSSKHRAAN